MFRLEESLQVQAPVERCFLLATSIQLVAKTIQLTPIKHKAADLIVAGDRLWWRGFKFGLPALHQTLITGYERPHFFQDTMGHGLFRHFQHDHHFDAVEEGTRMWDVVRFTLPFASLGRVVGAELVAPHVVDLMRRRFLLLKGIAEGDEWRRYLPELAAAADERARAVPPGIQGS